MSEKIKITEEDGTHKQWMIDAQAIKPEAFAEFMRHLIEDYDHDYGTICHAIAAIGVAAMNAANRSACGGITGFQASCITWEVIEGWGTHGKGPKSLRNYTDMLYPQYEDRFASTISDETWKYLQSEASDNLKKETNAHPDVAAHWQSIVAGVVPFGYEVRND